MKKKLLIVDDEADLVGTLKFMFESAGFEVSAAYDGVEALAKIVNDHPDLILLDVLIPKRDGYEICRTLKSDQKYKHIPVVLLTVKWREQDKSYGLECGADEYVIKPFEPKELLAIVK